MRAEDEVMWQGRKHVTKNRFAQIMDISPSYVNKLIGRGNLSAYSLNGSMAKYLDLELSKKAIALLPDVGGRRKKIGGHKKRFTENYAYDCHVHKDVKEPDVSEPAVGTPAVREDAMPAEIVDIDSLDRDKYADCLIEGTNIYDYDRLKARLTAETYEFKLEKEKGQHIPKNDIILSAKAIAQIIRTNLDAIPSRYASAFIALAETFSKHEFTEDEKIEIRNRLKGVGPQIMLSVQAEIGKLADE